MTHPGGRPPIPSVYGLSRISEEFYRQRAKEGIFPSLDAVAALRNDERRSGIPWERPERKRRTVKRVVTPKIPASSKPARPVIDIYRVSPRPIRISYEEAMARKSG